MLLRCPDPRWAPYQLYRTRCPRPLWPRFQLEQNIQKKFVRRPPGSHRCVRRPVGPTNTAQTPIPSCLYQARYIVLGCGNFVRGRKRKEFDSRPFYIISPRRGSSIQEKPVKTSHDISINNPVSQSYIYIKHFLVHDSIENRVPQIYYNLRLYKF